MNSNLHPIFQQALAPFMPCLLDDLKPFPPLKGMPDTERLAIRRAELMDEYRTGLDKTGPQWDEEGGEQ